MPRLALGLQATLRRVSNNGVASFLLQPFRETIQGSSFTQVFSGFYNSGADIAFHTKG